jgi:addiction module HigA family antidote
LDEPFSNLDYDIKLNIQRHLLDFQRQNGTTVILVTHDIEDAIALSDRVIVFSEKPTIIKAEIPIDMGLTQRELANAIHVPYQRINEIINRRRGITPSTALRLAKFFGMTRF